MNLSLLFLLPKLPYVSKECTADVISGRGKYCLKSQNTKKIYVSGL